MVKSGVVRQRNFAWGALAASVCLAWSSASYAVDDFTTPVAPAFQTSPAPQAKSGPAVPDSSQAMMYAPGTSRLGHEYVEIQPAVRTASQGIEVIEFLSYGSVASAKVDALLHTWAQGMPNFIRFSASPAGITPVWLNAARIFYALDSMTIEQGLRPELFKAITQNGLQYGEIPVLDVWLNAHGISATAFNQAFNSDLVISKTGNLPNVMALYHIEGIPSVVVDGRYVITMDSAGGVDKMPGVIGDVVNQVIKERRAAGE